MSWLGAVGRALVVMAVTTLLTLTAWTVLPLAWGWQAYTVTSGSMAPLIRPGDVVLADPDPSGGDAGDGTGGSTGSALGSGSRGIAVGTVVVIAPAVAGREPVTHRVVERLPDGRYRTQGDANGQPDSRLVRADELIGTGRVVVPLAGLVRLHAGRVLPALAGLALVAAVLLIRRRRAPAPPAGSGNDDAPHGSGPDTEDDDAPHDSGPDTEGDAATLDDRLDDLLDAPAADARERRPGDEPRDPHGDETRDPHGDEPRSTQSDDTAEEPGDGPAPERPAPPRSRRAPVRVRMIAVEPGPSRSVSRRAVATLVVAAVLLAVGSSLPGSGAAFTASTATQVNAWKSGYFYAAAVRRSKPVSYWRMGGSSTTSVADEMGRSALNLYNTPTVRVPGALTVDPDTATSFKNGTGPSYGAVTNDAYAIGGPMAVAAWTNASASTNWRLVFKGDAPVGKLNYLLSWSSDKGGSDMRFLVDAGGTRYETRAPWPSDKGWHFVAGVYDGAAIRIYIDGVEISSKAASGALVALPGLPLQVSENNASTGMTGSVDEVAVWDTALTGAQIAQLYALAKQ